MSADKWTRAINVPEKWEGRSAWQFNEWAENRGVYPTIIPQDFSREEHHCRGVWWKLLRTPKPPNVGATKGCREGKAMSADQRDEWLEGRVYALTSQIAKVLDEEEVKPPLRPKAWTKIRTAIRIALAEGAKAEGQT